MLLVVSITTILALTLFDYNTYSTDQLDTQLQVRSIIITKTQGIQPIKADRPALAIAAQAQSLYRKPFSVDD